MTWSMPRPVLQLVAVVLVLACAGSFAVGILTADPPARLPGETEAAGAAVEAQEAAPLSLERIEGAPPPKELTEEEKAQLEAEKKAKEEAAALAKAQAEAAALASQAPVEKGPQTPVLQQPADPLGDLLQKAPPPQPRDEPVF